jgi:2-dehydro-3-deoxyphosphooctonate aldolase (KDO 8-P synthase)
VRVGPVRIGRGRPLALIAGPCVIESREACLELAMRLARLAKRLGIPLVFKASYDKANRSSLGSYRGPGVEKGLEILAEVKACTGLPILTDVHTVAQAAQAAKVVDVLQIPAFLCRQTDLVVAAAETGLAVNIKKGQFLAPGDVGNIITKVESTGNRRVILTERGASFGYNNLVADMRSLLIMREFGYPVVFDATHSVQRPGGGGDHTAGDGRWAGPLAKAAVATGCDGVFVETHVDPSQALSDAENAIPFAAVGRLWRQLAAIHVITGGTR